MVAIKPTNNAAPELKQTHTGVDEWLKAVKISKGGASDSSRSLLPENRDAGTAYQPGLGEAALRILPGLNRFVSKLETDWISDDFYGPDVKGHMPQNIQLGQYGNGLFLDFAASYGGLDEEQRQKLAEDPGAFTAEFLQNKDGSINPEDVIGPRSSVSETGVVGSDDKRRLGMILSTAGATVGVSGNAGGAFGNTWEWLKDTRQGGAKSIGAILSFAGGSLGAAGAFLNLFGSSKVYTGQAVDNAESAEAFTANAAIFGAHAEVGEKTLVAQAEMMDKMSARLAQDHEGTFKDPLYAMRTVNQLAKLSGNPPVFTYLDYRALPEVTTGGDAVDIPLPADVFAVGPGGARRDNSHALINETNDRTAIDQIQDYRERDAQTGFNIGQTWGDNARSYVSEGGYESASARETGMTRMMNDVDAQFLKTGEAFKKYQTSIEKLKNTVQAVMVPQNWEKIAKGAGPAIAESFAKQQGIKDAKLVDVPPIGVNPKALEKTEDGGWHEGSRTAKQGYEFFEKLSVTSEARLKEAYSMEQGGNLGDVQDELHASFAGSGKEISPMPEVQQMVMDHILYPFTHRDGEPSKEEKDKAREAFTKDFLGNNKINPDGNFNMGHIFDAGVDLQLTFNMFGEGDEKRDTGKFTIEDTGGDPYVTAEILFGRIWDAVAQTIGHDNQRDTFTQQGTFFFDVTLNAVGPDGTLTPVQDTNGRSVREPDTNS